MPNRPTIVPCLRYLNCPAAIDFLCDAFGFTRAMVMADPADPTLIHHAQLEHGGGMIMLGSTRPGATQDRFGWKTPTEAGGITQCVYVVVADPDAHHAMAVQASATILDAPHDNEGYPGRSYTARDPEGNVWDFGSYAP